MERGTTFPGGLQGTARSGTGSPMVIEKGEQGQVLSETAPSSAISPALPVSTGSGHSEEEFHGAFGHRKNWSSAATAVASDRHATARNTNPL